MPAFSNGIVAGKLSKDHSLNAIVNADKANAKSIL
jgi:hypothetical protein